MDKFTLITPRLTLRPLTAADYNPIVDMVTDWDVVRMLARWPWPPDLSMVDDLIASNRADPTRGFGMQYGRDLAGTIGAGPRIGFMLRRGFWGLGIMTEALWAVQRHAIIDRGQAALRACVFVDNPGSHAVFRKCGWREVGQSRSTSAARGGEVDDIIYALNAADIGHDHS